MTHINMQISPAGKETGKQILRGLGALVFVVAIVWVGMQSFRVMPGARQLFANALVSVQSFFSPAERVVVSVVDSQVVIDEPFSVTWEHRGKENDGSYALIYECNDAVHLARVEGGAETTLFCNTEIPLLATETKLSLVAHGNINGVVTIPLSVRFTRNNASVTSEEGTVLIPVQDVRFDASAAATSTVPASTDTTAAGTTSIATTNGGTTAVTPHAGTPTTRTIPVITSPTSDPNGKVDFAIRVLAIGLVDKNSGDFSERSKLPKDLPSGKRGAIQFEIENIGTKKSGDSWNFTAKLPTSPAFTYTSPSQQELFPGDKISFVIGFDKLVNKDEASYTITVDSKDEVDESNEKNNSITRTIDIDR